MICSVINTSGSAKLAMESPVTENAGHCGDDFASKKVPPHMQHSPQKGNNPTQEKQ